jgi:hypothetical protein
VSSLPSDSGHHVAGQPWQITPALSGTATRPGPALANVGDVEGCRALIVGTKAFREAGGTVFLEDVQPHVRRTLTLLGVERRDRVFLV